MKSFIAGLLTIIALGIVGFYTFKATTKLMTNLNPSPSTTPSASASPSSTPIVAVKPTATPKAEPEDEGVATTKGGLPITTGKIKGVSTIYKPVVKKVVTTTTTTSHLLLTVVKTSICPISYMTEIKDITGPLTLKYKLIDNTSFGITVWKRDGNELVNNTTYSGNSGMIKTISGVDYMKIRIESKTCAANNDNWLTVTAER